MDYLQPKFYRFSEDSLWLANVASSSVKRAPLTLLDIGAGSGVVGIEAANRIPSVKLLTLLEPQKEFLPYLSANEQMLEGSLRVEVKRSRVEDFKSPEPYDLVLSNPPYFNLDSARKSPDKNKAMCRSFIESSLVEFVRQTARLTSLKGEAFILARESNEDVSKVLNIWSGKIKVSAKKGPVLILNFFHEQRS